MFSMIIEGNLSVINDVEPIDDSNNFECIEELFIELCTAIASIEGIAFVVNGFDIDWPVDVETDLATVIPQVFDAIESLKSGIDFSIELYEQGIEKELHFHITDNYVEVSCTHLRGGTRLPKLETISKYNLLEMLTQIKKQTLEAGRALINDFDKVLDTLKE